MAESKIYRGYPVYSSLFTYSGQHTINSSGYASLGTVLNGREILGVLVNSWGSATGAFSLAIAGGNNTLYIIGTPNAKVNDLAVKVIYR